MVSRCRICGEIKRIQDGIGEWICKACAINLNQTKDEGEVENNGNDTDNTAVQNMQFNNES